MYEIQQLAASVARDLLSAHYDVVQPESRLFRDLQALAIVALCGDEAHLESIGPP